MNNNYDRQLHQKNILRQLDERKILVHSIDNYPNKTVINIDNGFISIEQTDYNYYGFVFNLTYRTINNHPKNYDETISMNCTSYTLLINLLERELITNQIFKDKAGA